MSARRPPRWIEALLELSARGTISGQTLVGDLAEGYHARRDRAGTTAADLWYFRQTVSMVVHRAVGGVRGLFGRGGGGFEPFRQDVAWTLRSVARRPWFGLGVALILTLAVSATTAAVSLVTGTYRAASWWSGGERTLSLWPNHGMSLGQLLTLRQEAAGLGEIGAWTHGTSSISDDGVPPRSVASVTISPNVFAALTAQPSLGRGLSPDDEKVGAEPVVVLGDGLWRRAFGADLSAVGRLITVDGVRRRIVGVQGRGGSAPGVGTELWVPIEMNAFDEEFWPRQDYELVALLPGGASVEEAHVEFVRVLQVLARRFSFFYPSDYGLDATVAPANEPVWAPLRSPLALLMAGSLLLLLVAAIDLGNLFLGRSLERAGELRVRAVLGAGRGRIVSQLVVEGGLWTAVGLFCGLGAGLALAGRLAAIFPVGSQVVSLGLGRELIGFVGATGLLVWVLMSGVPVVHFLRTTRAGLSPSRFGGHRAQGALVVTQAALATCLLVSAGLLVRSVQHLGAIPVGFDGRDAVALRVTTNDADDDDALRAFYDQLARAMEDGRGVRAVGLAATLPLLDPVASTPINRYESPSEVAAAPHAFRHVVDAGYVDALGARIREGRGIEADDRSGSEAVVVVNATMAQQLWPGESALGRRVAVDPHGWDEWLTVVGVLDDVRFQDLTRPVPPAYYVPFSQAPLREMYVIVSGGQGVADAGAAVRARVAALDAGTAVGRTHEMGRVVADAYGAVRIMMALLVVLAVLATALGAVGLYGALASYVTRHRVELSTRMALGAQPERVFRGVVAVGVTLTGVGVAVGSALAAAGGGLVRSLLFGVSPLDPASFGLAALALGAVGVLAAAVPAARAALVAPAEVLREG